MTNYFATLHVYFKRNQLHVRIKVAIQHFTTCSVVYTPKANVVRFGVFRILSTNNRYYSLPIFTL